MTDFIQMHVFFAVTTAATILVTALVCAVLVATFRLLRTLNHLASEVKEEAIEIRADLDDLREGMQKGFRLVPLFSFFNKAAKRVAKEKKPRSRTRKQAD